MQTTDKIGYIYGSLNFNGNVHCIKLPFKYSELTALLYIWDN